MRERERERERQKWSTLAYRKIYKKIKTTRESIYIRIKTEKYKEKERKKPNEMC